MRLYLAGPMSGIPHFNFPAFEDAAEHLRLWGHDVVSPAELDSPAHREAAQASEDGDIHAYNEATGETWADLLARDVKVLSDEGIEGVVVLPMWETSRGARLETFVASAIHGLPVYDYANWNAGGMLQQHEIPMARLRAAWAPQTEAEAVLPPLGEERITSSTGGQKGRKPQRFELLPWKALAKVAEVYSFGAKKYDDHNWRKGYEWSLSFGALQRHLSEWWEGNDRDEESGLSHLAHAGFHVLTLLVFESVARYREMDDRPREPSHADS